MKFISDIAGDCIVESGMGGSIWEPRKLSIVDHVLRFERDVL